MVIEFYILYMLQCVGRVPSFASVICTRPRGTIFQPLLECVGPVPPSTSIFSTDSAGRFFSFTFCRCLSAWGLYPFRVCRLYRLRGSVSIQFGTQSQRGRSTPGSGVESSLARAINSTEDWILHCIFPLQAQRAPSVQYRKQG